MKSLSLVCALYIAAMLDIPHLEKESAKSCLFSSKLTFGKLDLWAFGEALGTVGLLCV